MHPNKRFFVDVWVSPAEDGWNIVVRRLLILGCALGIALEASSKPCRVYADLADQQLFLEQAPDTRMGVWEEGRQSFWDAYHRWMGRRYSGFRDHILPSQETFPWFHISSKAETAAVIQAYLLGVEGRPVPKSEMPKTPKEMIEGWLQDYVGFEQKKHQALEKGFIDFFNERQFEKAMKLAKDRNMGEMDEIVVDLAVAEGEGKVDEKFDGKFAIESRTYRVTQVRAFEKRNQSTRRDGLGKMTLFPLFQSKGTAAQEGNFSGGKLMDIEIEHAELFRRLSMLRYRMENLKDTLERAGRGEEFAEHQPLLTNINRALGAEVGPISKHAMNLRPSAKAMKLQLRREMLSQVAGWRSSQQDRDKTLKDHLLTGLLNPTSLTDLGGSDTSNTRRILKFLLNTRVQLIGLGLTTLGGITATWWNRYKETFRPDLECAELKSDADFEACVNRYMKNYFGREWVRTKLDVSHQPFEDQALKAQHREKLRWFWAARSRELDRLRRLDQFNKPAREGLKEFRAEYETSKLPKEEETSPLLPADPAKQRAVLYLFLQHGDQLRELQELADVAVDASRDPLTRRLAKEKAETLGGQLQERVKAFMATEPSPEGDDALRQEVDALIEKLGVQVVPAK